jgi:hypothetical protein
MKTSAINGKNLPIKVGVKEAFLMIQKRFPDFKRHRLRQIIERAPHLLGVLRENPLTRRGRGGKYWIPIRMIEKFNPEDNLTPVKPKT